MKSNKKWCIEFWDFGQWDEYGNNKFQYKSQAIEFCNKLNKEIKHEDRQCFEGHRFRVRKIKEN